MCEEDQTVFIAFEYVLACVITDARGGLEGRRTVDRTHASQAARGGRPAGSV